MRDEVKEIIKECDIKTKGKGSLNRFIHFFFIGESGEYLARMFLNIFDGIEIVRYNGTIQSDKEWVLIEKETGLFHQNFFAYELSKKLRKKGFHVYAKDIHKTIQYMSNEGLSEDEIIIKRLE